MAMTLNFGVWALVCFFSVSHERFTLHLLPSILLLFVSLLVISFVPHKLAPSEESGHSALLLRLFGPLVCCLLNLFNEGSDSDIVYQFLTMVNYDLTFMCQGILDQTYKRQQYVSIS